MKDSNPPHSIVLFGDPRRKIDTGKDMKVHNRAPLLLELLCHPMRS